MLRKDNRLTAIEFGHYFSVGRRYHAGPISLIFSPSEEFKAAIVVGKKVFKSAVKRNRLRRQLYHLLANLRRQSPTQTGIHIVLIKPAAKTTPVRNLLAGTKELINQAWLGQSSKPR